MKGTNHWLHDNLGVNANTMIVGADVTHSGKGADPGYPSMAGVVATVDNEYTQYFASTRWQSNNTEVSHIPQCEDPANHLNSTSKLQEI